jgi:integrase
MQTKLTAQLVRRLTQEDAPTRDISYFDLVVPRFALRVMPPRYPGGPWVSSYFVKYTAPDGRPRRVKVGNPGTMELEEARKAGKRVLGQVDQGRDPSADRAALRAAWTVAEAATAYQASPEFMHKTERSRAGDAAHLKNHISYYLGGTRLAAVDVPEVKRLLRSVETDKRTNGRKRRLGGPGAARKAVRVLSALMTWAVGEGQIKTNPIIGNLRLDGDNGRETVISSVDQYAALFEAMDDLVAHGDPPLRPMARAFITVKAWTGMRRGELQRLQWGQVDLEARRITLIETKGAKLARNKHQQPRTEFVSLPEPACEALAAIRPEDPLLDDPVFVPVRGEVFSINRDWNRVRDHAGLPCDLVLHGLRHSVGTAGATAGMSALELQKLLRHRNMATVQKYIHLAEAAQSRLQERAMSHLLAAKVARPRMSK